MGRSKQYIFLLREKIIDLYQNKKMTYRQISDLLGTCDGTISKTLKANNIKIRNKDNISTWSELEIEWLLDNYEKLGNAKCAKFLNKPYKAISYKAKVLGIKYERCDKFDIEKFNKISPELSYFLGYFFADGCIRNSRYKKVPVLNMTIQTSDAEEIKDTIFKTGHWRFYQYEKRGMSQFTTYSWNFYNFLMENGFHDKSIYMNCKILEKIPEDLWNLFIRGLLDGDGSIRVRCNTSYEVNFAGAYEQNWEFLQYILNKREIQFSISKKIYTTENKIYKSSSFNITGLDNVFKFLNFIYTNRKHDNIGLYRKYKKYVELVHIFKDKFKDNTMNNIAVIHNKLFDSFRVYIGKNCQTFHNLSDAISFRDEIKRKTGTKEYRIEQLLLQSNELACL